MRAILVAAATIALSACVTARMHSVEELNSAGERCGLALGELFQDEEEKRLVFLFRSDPTPKQRACVAKWARRNGLRPVFVQLNLPEG